MNSQVHIKLTAAQYRELQPVIDRAIAEAEKGQPGIILGQPVPVKLGDTSKRDRSLYFSFVPYAQGKKIVAILETIE